MATLLPDLKAIKTAAATTRIRRAICSLISRILPPVHHPSTDFAPWNASAALTEDVHPCHVEVLRGLQHVAVQFSDGNRLHVHIVTHRLNGGSSSI